MVRNGVVAHPSLWSHGGYPEIQKLPKRYSIIDRERLIACCGFDNDEQLIKEHKQWVDEAICAVTGRGNRSGVKPLLLATKIFFNIKYPISTCNWHRTHISSK